MFVENDQTPLGLYVLLHCAGAAPTLISPHTQQFKAERRDRLSCADQITLYSEIVAAVEVELKAHRDNLHIIGT